MATIEYWIQLENRPWDLCPNNIDRLTGQTIQQLEGTDPVIVSLTPTGGGPAKSRTMFKPLRLDGNVVDALILRRYKPPVNADQSDAWTAPDDRKVNPWDVNEPDPTDNGTMGTIPGPVIECNVGDEVIVNFRNMDMRAETRMQKQCFQLPFGQEFCFDVPLTVPLPIEKRLHSMHPHGFVFEVTSDGAYPLSPPDTTQPVGAEAAAWALVPKFSGGFKHGDRVPPGGTYRYSWRTIGWPSTAGVWLYHDHSICDMENVELGAIGIIVIHNPADVNQEVDIRDPQNPEQGLAEFLPGGSLNGSPINPNCFHFPPDFDLVFTRGSLSQLMAQPAASGHGDTAGHTPRLTVTPGDHSGPMFQQGLLGVELTKELDKIHRICFPVFRTPPTKALYLQLYHALTGGRTIVNGRQYLGNTPTMLAGTSTRMRFGVVGMGSDIHTFHIHGHRWILPGPDGNTPGAIQGSPQVRSVSQFEDTRIFGPANSFVFTIDGAPGSFMRAGGRGADQSLGEWHMHCHMLSHMMTGMMGSLMIVKGGEFAAALPSGVPCPGMEPTNGGGGDHGGGGTGPATHTVKVQDFQFSPKSISVKVGDTVNFVWEGNDHSATADDGSFDSGVHNAPHTFSRVFSAAGTVKYFCSIHGAPNGGGMSGTVTVTA